MQKISNKSNEYITRSRIGSGNSKFPEHIKLEVTFRQTFEVDQCGYFVWNKEPEKTVKDKL